VSPRTQPALNVRCERSAWVLDGHSGVIPSEGDFSSRREGSPGSHRLAPALCHSRGASLRGADECVRPCTTRVAPDALVRGELILDVILSRGEAAARDRTAARSFDAVSGILRRCKILVLLEASRSRKRHWRPDTLVQSLGRLTPPSG
jgi:hypothetical protein